MIYRWCLYHASKYIYVKRDLYNIAMIVPIAINGVISRMEGIHKIPTIVKKPRVRPYDMKINTVKI